MLTINGWTILAPPLFLDQMEKLSDETALPIPIIQRKQKRLLQSSTEFFNSIDESGRSPHLRMASVGKA
jgi:hypothetical protein